jgi:hypothetical protein
MLAVILPIFSCMFEYIFFSDILQTSPASAIYFIVYYPKRSSSATLTAHAATVADYSPPSNSSSMNFLRMTLAAASNSPDYPSFLTVFFI